MTEIYLICDNWKRWIGGIFEREGVSIARRPRRRGDTVSSFLKLRYGDHTLSDVWVASIEATYETHRPLTWISFFYVCRWCHNCGGTDEHVSRWVFENCRWLLQGSFQVLFEIRAIPRASTVRILAVCVPLHVFIVIISIWFMIIGELSAALLYTLLNQLQKRVWRRVYEGAKLPRPQVLQMLNMV